MRVARQAVLPFGRKDVVLNRQIRERAEGRKVRPGLGRPRRQRTKGDGRVGHGRRPLLQARSAVHVTVHLRQGMPDLRVRRRFNVVKRAFVKFCGAGLEASASPSAVSSDARGSGVGASPVVGFRLVHFAVLSTHLHFVVEADSARALSMGMQKVLHSISRRLNALSVEEAGGRVSTKGGAYRLMPGWLGRVFSDRYYAHVLKTPTEMANALRYVILNAEHHGVRRMHGSNRGIGSRVDAFTSIGALGTDSAAAVSEQEPPLTTRPRGFLLSRACQQLLAWLRL